MAERLQGNDLDDEKEKKSKKAEQKRLPKKPGNGKNNLRKTRGGGQYYRGVNGHKR